MAPTARSQISSALRWPTVLPLVKPPGEVCEAGSRGAFIRGKPPGFRQKAKEVVKIPYPAWDTAVAVFPARALFPRKRKKTPVNMLTDKKRCATERKDAFEFNFNPDFAPGLLLKHSRKHA
ncbi:MAG: hypothetical protein K0B15_04660 [Lentimicrobium sp.]|nr:hypothetical protein [Lentimicrobium sp.]